MQAYKKKGAGPVKAFLFDGSQGAKNKVARYKPTTQPVEGEYVVHVNEEYVVLSAEAFLKKYEAFKPIPKPVKK